MAAQAQKECVSEHGYIMFDEMAIQGLGFDKKYVKLTTITEVNHFVILYFKVYSSLS